MTDNDSPELEALFDSIVRQTGRPSGPDEKPAAPAPSLFEHVGKLARQLHDTLKELGYDQLLENTLHSIPDARDRLAYVASMTEQAARRVLDAADIANPLQEALAGETAALGERWNRLFDNRMDAAEFRLLAADTRAFLTAAAPARIAGTRRQLSEIVMAQDFQDLTGQVIRRIVAMAQDLEKGLVHVLIEGMPEAGKADNGFLDGPVINADGRSDVLTNQQQVDDLLASLGF